MNCYTEARERLSHAFKPTASTESDPENAALALRFVDALRRTSPVNLPGLDAALKAREELLWGGHDASLDAAEYMQVRLIEAIHSLLLLPCCLGGATTRASAGLHALTD